MYLLTLFLAVQQNQQTMDSVMTSKNSVAMELKRRNHIQILAKYRMSKYVKCSSLTESTHRINDSVKANQQDEQMHTERNGMEKKENGNNCYERIN